MGTQVPLGAFAEISRTKYEVGRQSQAEALGAEVELARNAEARFDLDRQLAEGESELNALLNRNAYVPLPISAADLRNPPAVPSGTATLAFALANRPELQTAHAKVAAAEAGLQMARREWIPDPAVRVTAMRYNDSKDAVSEYAAGLSFNLPWLNVKKYSAGTREAASALERARHELQAQQAEAGRLVRDQIVKLETSAHHYQLYHEKIAQLSVLTARSTQSAYESDKATFLELSTAQRNAQAVEFEVIDHLFDAQKAAAELRAIIGAEPDTESSK